MKNLPRRISSGLMKNTANGEKKYVTGMMVYHFSFGNKIT